MIIHTFPYGVLQANCYIVTDDGQTEAIVIDPTAPPDIVLKQLPPQIKVKYICITHAHVDHLDYYDDWMQTTRAQSVISEREADALSKGHLNLSLLFYQKDIIYRKADILAREGDKLIFGQNESVEVIETPGHTHGSCCFLCQDALFTGDTIFAAGGRGRTDFPSGNEKQLRQSILKLLTLSNKVRIYPGHGPTSNIETEKHYHIF